MGRFDGIDPRDALRRILPFLYRIEEGAGFCEDRGYPWTLEMEERAGRSLIAETFSAFPEIAALMPERAAALASRRLLGEVNLSTEIETARKAMNLPALRSSA